MHLEHWATKLNESPRVMYDFIVKADPPPGSELPAPGAGLGFAPTSRVQPLERLDTLRKRLLLLLVAVGVPVVLTRHLLIDAGWWKTGWLLAFLGTIGWLGLQPASAPQWKLVAPAVLGTLLAPLACAMAPVDNIEIATLALVPMVMAVLFLDSFELVYWVSGVGWLANLVFFMWLGWPWTELVMAGIISGGALAATVLAAAGARKLRQLDRQTETQHNQALRLSETRRAQAERLAIVGRLASGVAHEINNPLAFVKANVGALKRSLSQPGEELSQSELAELLSDTTQGIDRICQIVADLKGFAREDSGVMEPVDVHDVVTGSVRLATVRLPRNVKVAIEVPRDLPPVRASQRKLSQVLLNLLVNAGEALEEARTAQPTVVIRAEPMGDTLRLIVTDNGPGFPAAVVARLFEPFFTTKPPGKGTGLGLALSREYVEAFGGTLVANNASPHGAQFCLTLRVALATGETPLPSTFSPEPLHLGRRPRTLP